MSGFLRGGLCRPMGSFRKWKNLCHVGVEGCERGLLKKIEECEEGGVVLCDHSCTYDTYR